jgi:hypothetical protein
VAHGIQHPSYGLGSLPGSGEYVGRTSLFVRSEPPGTSRVNKGNGMIPRWTAPFAIVVLVGVNGCAEQRRAEAIAEIQRQREICAAQFAGDGHAVARENCVGPVRREAMVSTGFPPDLTDLLIADRLNIAAKIDSGRITKEQANVEIAQIGVEINEMAASRRRQNALAAAAILSAMPQQAPIQTQFYPIQQPPSRSFSCYTYGNMTSCN